MVNGDTQNNAGHGSGQGTGAEALDLGAEERLPWLESADDVDLEDEGPDNGRLIGFGVLALILLAAIVGAIYWATHRNAAPAAADGSLIEASKEPYKVAPKDPGGKTFQGTGDSSFKVSEGERPTAALAAKDAPAAAPSATPAAHSADKHAEKAADKPAAPAVSGVGVQVGAFSSQALAETGWNKLVVAHQSLKGMNHRVIAGKADIGTVYRLQAVPGDVAAANALCNTLQGEGVKCQVKR